MQPGTQLGGSSGDSAARGAARLEGQPRAEHEDQHELKVLVDRPQRLDRAVRIADEEVERRRRQHLVREQQPARAGSALRNGSRPWLQHQAARRLLQLSLVTAPPAGRARTPATTCSQRKSSLLHRKQPRCHGCGTCHACTSKSARASQATRAKWQQLCPAPAPQVEEDGGAEDDGREQAALRAREPRQHVRDHLVQHRRRRQQQARVARHLRARRAARSR